MRIMKQPLLSFLVLAGLSLHAQLVEKAPPAAKGSSSRTHAGANSAGKNAPAKGLESVGITNRALVTWKRSGTTEEIGFKVVAFQRNGATDKGSPTFQMNGRDAFVQTDITPLLGTVRVGKTGPEMQLRNGGPWISGERVKDSWIFGFDNQTITIDPMDEAFTPKSFRALAFERGVVVKQSKEMYDNTVSPFFHTVVMAVAYGRNEFQGIIKYPGAAFVVPFQGIHFKDRWIARSLVAAPFNTLIYRPSGGFNNFGAEDLRVGENYLTQVELTDRSLLLGTGKPLNYAVQGESSERLWTAIEFEIQTGKEVPALAEAFHGNLQRPLWTKTDEEGSFSREAEKALVQAGMKAWFWAPYNDGQRATFIRHFKAAHESLDPMIKRLHTIGAEFRFLTVNGTPIAPSRQ